MGEREASRSPILTPKFSEQTVTSASPWLESTDEEVHISKDFETFPAFGSLPFVISTTTSSNGE